MTFFNKIIPKFRRFAITKTNTFLELFVDTLSDKYGLKWPLKIFYMWNFYASSGSFWNRLSSIRVRSQHVLRQKKMTSPSRRPDWSVDQLIFNSPIITIWCFCTDQEVWGEESRLWRMDSQATLNLLLYTAYVCDQRQLLL